MSDRGFDIWLAIFGIGLLTLIVRYAPLALLARLELPTWGRRALRFVPPAVMSAIVTPALFFAGGTATMTADMPRVLAATFAALVAWRTRSTLLTVVLGMLVLWALQALTR